MSVEAISLFNEIKDPNEIIITLFFNACAQLGTEKELKLIKRVSSNIPVSFYSNDYVLTSLIDAFMKCGDVTYAKSFFDKSTNKTLPMYAAMMKGKYVVFFSSNSLMSNEFFLGYIKNNSAKRAIELFKEVKNPDTVVALLLFNACAHLGTSEALNSAKNVSSTIPQSFYTDPNLSTSLIDVFMKCDDVTSAKSLFNTSTIIKTSSLYAAMMKG